jgi:alanine racemase
MKRAFAEVNLKQIKTNYLNFKSQIAPGVKIMAVVKADGYGHGAIPVAETCLALGANFLGVAWETEARHLRQAGIKAPILVLSESVFDLTSDLVSFNLSQTLYSQRYYEILDTALKKLQTRLKVHIKVDTGMGRIGASPEQALALIQKIKTNRNFILEGIYTHFSCAESDPAYTHNQIESFEKFLKLAQPYLDGSEMIHAANSAGTINFPEAHYNMVRVGIGLYRGALTLKSFVSHLKTVPSKTAIGYGASYKTNQSTQIATVSIGYADGYSRSLSNQGQVLIRKQIFPVVGTVSMDMLMLDVGQAQLAVGDEVILMGHPQYPQISLEEIARQTGTIDYEIMCGIGKRVPRIYLH